MKKSCFVLALILCGSNLIMAQQNDSALATRELDEVIVRAYEHNRNLREVGASLNIIREAQLQKFSSNSVVQAINSTPGVRMEERSPGSYRLNIRGSSLRSPFGVRNVKVYWNDIPFTDPSGNTYFNQFSFYNFSSLEILKGPGSSLYGAGSGGVILAQGFDGNKPNEAKVEYTRGSFNSNNLYAGAVFGNASFKNKISYTYQNSDGYRDQTAMHRSTFSWETDIKSSERYRLSTHVLYGDLYYQTPGGLTLAQYTANPKAARPAGGGFPSAQQVDAAIYQKTFWAGINQQYIINSHWQNSTSVYGAFTQLKNSAIRNYEKRTEPHFGGRSTFTYSTTLQQTKLKWVTGAEAQQGNFNVRVFKNNKGNPDSLQTDDEVKTSQIALFTQAELSFTRGWIFTAGVSWNKSNVEIRRTSLVPNFIFNSDYKNEWAPRFSLLKQINNHWSWYAVVSKGFSPPTTQELLPSTSVINTTLQAEQGWNYELGTRATLLNNRLTLDISGFYYRLNNAIVQRKDISGADYFANAGSTKQKGIETSVSFELLSHSNKIFKNVLIWGSHSYHHFRYDAFKQVANDFSGKTIPGEPLNAVSAGFDINFKAGFFVHGSYYYNDRIMLNDANTDIATSFQLLGFKAGYSFAACKHLKVSIFSGGDNLTNQTYSMGNDINAAAGRYYNASPGVNYYAGISLQAL